LCANVIGRPFHHQAPRGVVDRSPVQFEQYDQIDSVAADFLGDEQTVGIGHRIGC
jgi:hypothetical protein